MPTSVRPLISNCTLLKSILPVGSASIPRSLSKGAITSGLPLAPAYSPTIAKVGPETTPPSANFGKDFIAAIIAATAAKPKAIPTNGMLECAAIAPDAAAVWNKKADAIKNAGKEAEKTSVSTGKALKDGWGGIKNIGSSIEGITDALKGNGNAWQLVVGIIDGFIGLYDGFQTVISIISRLTGVTNMSGVLDCVGFLIPRVYLLVNRSRFLLTRIFQFFV